MASYTDTSLLHELVEHVLPYADSLGMNEQELPNLLSILKYGNVSYVSDSYPRVATVLDAMRDVYELLKANAPKKGSTNPDDAGRRPLHPPAHSHSRLPGNPGRQRLAVEELARRCGQGGAHRPPLHERDFEICVAPVLVCTKVLHTGGGGDNVSAAGIVLQV
ncbi:hypothetical protein MRX96_021686 [Rhipicephalus microplus]